MVSHCVGESRSAALGREVNITTSTIGENDWWRSRLWQSFQLATLAAIPGQPALCNADAGQIIESNLVAMNDRDARERRPPMKRAALALVLSSMLWGTTGTAASLLPADVSPLAVGSATMGVGGVLLFGISMGPAISALQDPTARRWLLVGAAGVVVYPLAFYGAMNLAGVAIGNVVALGSGPVFAAFFEWAWERRRPGRVWVACTATAPKRMSSPG